MGRTDSPARRHVRCRSNRRRRVARHWIRGDTVISRKRKQAVRLPRRMHAEGRLGFHALPVRNAPLAEQAGRARGCWSHELGALDLVRLICLVRWRRRAILAAACGEEGDTGEREPKSDCANGAPPAASVFRRETHSPNHNDLAGPRKTRESSTARPERRRLRGRTGRILRMSSNSAAGETGPPRNSSITSRVGRSRPNR
jgi:hypothetical protein